jgi:hypothetical protein
MGSYSSSASFIGWKGKVILCKINDIRHSRRRIEENEVRKVAVERNELARSFCNG